MATEAPKKKKRVKASQKIRQGKVYIKSTYNNTIITVTDARGNVLTSSSAGRVGFRGARKATPFAAQRAMGEVLEHVRSHGLEEVTVFVRGIGSAREAAIRSLNIPGLTITSIRDITPIPHNGVRPPKRRRV